MKTVIILLSAVAAGPCHSDKDCSDSKDSNGVLKECCMVASAAEAVTDAKEHRACASRSLAGK